MKQSGSVKCRRHCKKYGDKGCGVLPEALNKLEENKWMFNVTYNCTAPDLPFVVCVTYIPNVGSYGIFGAVRKHNKHTL